MNKKTFIQISLSLLILVVLIFFYLKYFNHKKVVINLKIDENIKNDLMEGIEYFSSDARGNSYTVKAKSGLNESENLDTLPQIVIQNKICFYYQYSFEIDTLK